jgi:rRNA maturation endonuclease Nob1
MGVTRLKDLCLTPRKNGRDTMDEEQPQPSSEESREEAALLKLQEEFRHFVHECRECRRELEAHWQFCAHCGIRLATHCPGCGNPLPPPGAHACPRCGLAVPQVSP